MKTFTFNRGSSFGIFATSVLILLTLLMVYTPIAQLLAGRTPQYEVAFVYPVLLYLWYMRLKPTKSILVNDMGQLTFVTPFGATTVPVIEVQSIRPFLNLSKRDFVLHHRGGYEFLFDDPTAVSLVTREILSKNPQVQVRGVPSTPPSVS
jgi:hypothetical protein